MGKDNTSNMAATTMIVGNIASSVDTNKWKWQMVVDCNEHADLIHSVVLHLHPTFKNNRIEINASTNGIFKSNIFTGWGTFTVGVELQWIDGTTNILEHHLIFENGGHSAPVTLELPAALIEPEPEPVPEPVVEEVFP